jgi:hypothetical protein
MGKISSVLDVTWIQTLSYVAQAELTERNHVCDTRSINVRIEI